MSPSQQLTIEQAISRANKAAKQGNLAVAQQLYKAILQHLPNHPIAKNGLRELQKQLSRYKSVQVQTTDPSPDRINALINLYHSGQMTKAEQAGKELLQTYPQSLTVLNVLGAVLAGQGQLQQAVQVFDKVIQLKPDDAQAYINRGNVLTSLGQLKTSVENYDRAIRLKPDDAEAYSNRGNAFTELGQLKAAVEDYNQAVQLKPDLAGAYSNRGNALAKLGQLEEAIDSYNQAIQIQPDFAEAYYNRGNALTNLGQVEEAVESCHKAIQLKPDYVNAYSNLLFNLQYKTDFDPEFYLSQAQKFRLNCRPQRITPPAYTYQKNPTTLKIGLVSSDFGNHPGGYFSLSTLRELSQKNLELIAYSNFERSDQWAPQFRPLFAQWHSIQKQTDEDVVAQVVKDGIHILIDLQGYTSGNRLSVFFYRPAPVQASWLSPGSTGIEEIDYYLGSPYLIPEGEEKHFSEQVLRLPETEACFTPPDFDLPINNLPARSNSFITFGCFNKLVKMNDQVLALWCRILSAVPNSKLLLKSKILSNPKMVAQTRHRFKHYDIDPGRLALQGWSASRKESLLAYHQVDIALDPFPFQGHATTCEAVWMGVPVLVLKGDRLMFHAGENVNYNLGMDDWVAENQDQYLSQAVMFSSDLDQLATIRSDLRQQALKSPLFDAPRFADHFSRILWQMWSKKSGQ